jgi:hypothetical protein
LGPFHFCGLSTYVYFRQTLTIAGEFDDRLNETTHLYISGDFYIAQGNIELARQYLAQAVTIFEGMKSPYAGKSRRLLAQLGQA